MIPSNNGVPVSLRPGITAMSPLVIDSLSATINVTTAGANVSAYLTPYNSYIASGYVNGVYFAWRLQQACMVEYSSADLGVNAGAFSMLPRL